MEFDSPDVAKDFPGLYYEDVDEAGEGGGKKGKKAKVNHGSMNDPNDYDDDSDKSSKKKKEKKDSKKDKGYAALAGESSSDEDERPGSKSPGRVKKLKAFKLTSSSKKHKDKDKEKDAKADTSSKVVAGTSTGESSKKDKKHSLSVEKDLKRERKLSSEAKPSKSEKSLLDLVRKHSVPNPVSTSVSLPPPTAIERPSSTGRNRHPVPFSPTAAAAKEEKHSKKEIIDGVKVRLKLKRGSKNSLEEPAADHPAAAAGPAPSQNQQSPSGRQLPEDPETLAKEIKKYEALLEQSHSQIQSSKKVNKKHEEQLWELQRTLTQLKRKLRSVNALSSASITIAANTTIAPATTAPKHIESTYALAQPQRTNVEPPHAQAQTILQPQKVPIEAVVVVGVVAPPELIPEPVEEISHAGATAASSSKQGLPPAATVETTAQVHATAEVQVHATERAAKYPITDDREYENITIGMGGQEPGSGQSGRGAVLEKKGSVSSSSSIGLAFENVGDRDSSGRSKTSSGNPSTTSHVHVQEQQQRQQPRSNPDALDEVDTEFSHLHLSNHVDARAKRNSLPSSQRLQQERVDVDGDGNGADSESFNPFAVPLFQTDEFIALENEALIMFNQALQDQIIGEEAEVDKLVKQLGGLMEDNHGLLLGVTIQDLEELDNDELVSMFEEVKHENDVLHDQVNKLKSLVAKAKLEEFQLELRLKYLQEQHGQELGPAQAQAAAAVVA